MPALATWAPEDGVLGAVAPLALASTQPTSLVVDLDPAGPAYPSERSLRDLVEAGPRAAELSPRGTGLAVLRNGGVEATEAQSIVQILIKSWPAVVLRLPPQAPTDVPAPFVPIHLLIPGRLFPPPGRGVLQPLPGAPRSRRSTSGLIVLPPAPRRVIVALLEGRRPASSRWLAKWRNVWRATW